AEGEPETVAVTMGEIKVAGECARRFRKCGDVEIGGRESFGKKNAHDESRCEGLAPTAGAEALFNRFPCRVERDAVLVADAARVFASRKADDVRRARSDVANMLFRERFECVDVDAFAREA